VDVVDVVDETQDVADVLDPVDGVRGCSCVNRERRFESAGGAFALVKASRV